MKQVGRKQVHAPTQTVSDCRLLLLNISYKATLEMSDRAVKSI